MSSKVGRFLSWVMSFILGALFLLIGTFCLALPWSELLRAEVVQLIINDPFVIAVFGLGFALIGFSIFIYNFLTLRKQTLYIRTGRNAVIVDKDVIHQYLDKYWKEQFPHCQVPSVIMVKKKAIHITADLPPLSSMEKELFQEQVEKDLNHLFGNLLGYPHEVFFTASFKPKTAPPPAHSPSLPI